MSKAKLYAKILKAKMDFDPVLKDCNNPFFKSKYSDLNGILGATEPALQKNGLLVLQPNMGRSVVTQIIDTETGEMAESSLDIPESITKPQDVGACITYFRRFTLKALLGLTEEDDDGNSLNDKANAAKDAPNVAPPKVEAKAEAPKVETKPVQAEVPKAHSYRRELPTPGTTNGVAKPAAPAAKKSNAWDGA
jgi:hypothetical protein